MADPVDMTRGCRGNGPCRNNGGCGELLQKIREIDFSLTETVLYLDAYPCSSEAMQYYNKLIAERRQLVDTYEKQCGPLTMYGNQGRTWEWVEGPWPWEPEAN